MNRTDSPAREISPRTKDKLLTFLVENLDIAAMYTVKKEDILPHMKPLEEDIINGIFMILHRDEYLIEYARHSRSYNIALGPSAPEFVRRGGYTAKQDIIDRQLTLLEEQIKDLQTSQSHLPKVAELVKTVLSLGTLIRQFF